jgi:hypothetical protein
MIESREPDIDDVSVDKSYNAYYYIRDNYEIKSRIIKAPTRALAIAKFEDENPEHYLVSLKEFGV